MISIINLSHYVLLRPICKHIQQGNLGIIKHFDCPHSIVTAQAPAQNQFVLICYENAVLPALTMTYVVHTCTE